MDRAVEIQAEMAPSPFSNNAMNKKKVLFIMGSTGTGKTKLSISLALRFSAEIINSDKIQVYKGLDVITNKASEHERQGVPHHLLGIIDDPNYDFTVRDFCLHAHAALEDITGRGHLPIVVGGSNTYLRALIGEPNHGFREKYDCCFIWLDVALPVLFDHVGKRVDEMVQQGVVDEIREAYVAGADYTRGIRRAIGVPELDTYVQAEKEGTCDASHIEELLKEGIRLTKENTNALAAQQLEKIMQMKNEMEWELHRIDCTEVFETSDRKVREDVWEKKVFEPSLKMVKDFLEQEETAAVQGSYERVSQLVNHIETSAVTVPVNY